MPKSKKRQSIPTIKQQERADDGLAIARIMLRGAAHAFVEASNDADDTDDEQSHIDLARQADALYLAARDFAAAVLLLREVR